ncbi:hypothetical protein G9A89_020907 [Geosiphon pyriformis]|nr:hypothetical protein G9A89_020907 [Geosiphon pyriformis]
MLSGSTCRATAALCTYFMKTVHFRLPVAVQKRLYNKVYPGVSCLFCGDVELPDHGFTCVKDASVWSDILGDFGGLWRTLMSPNLLLPSFVLQDFSLGVSDVRLYSVFCKRFVLKSWMDEATVSFSNKKKVAIVIVNFIHRLAKSHRMNFWLFRTKFRSDMERSGLIGDNVVVVSALGVGALSFSAGMVYLIGVLDSLDVSFGFRGRFLFLSGAVHRHDRTGKAVNRKSKKNRSLQKPFIVPKKQIQKDELGPVKKKLRIRYNFVLRRQFKTKPFINTINETSSERKTLVENTSVTKTIVKSDIWLEGVKQDLNPLYSNSELKSTNLLTNFNLAKFEKRQNRIGKYIAMDCEMVGVGPDGIESALARVSIVNFHGTVILDKYVRPLERITDFRTSISGITPDLLIQAHEFKDVQKEIAEILQDRIIIGHSIHYDFRALLLNHPHRMIRDTSLYTPLRQHARGKTPSLKKLAKEELGLIIQQGTHSSVSIFRRFFIVLKNLLSKFATIIGGRCQSLYAALPQT